MTLQDMTDTTPATCEAQPIVGRPAIECTDETINQVCELVAMGSNLTAIGNDTENGLPSKSVLYKWLSENRRGFQEVYARAREARADSRADRIDDIAQRVETGELRPDQGRVLIDTEKWQAGKEKPKVYGDKHVIEGGEKPVQIESRNELLAAIVAVIQDGGNGDIGTLLTQGDAKSLESKPVPALGQGEQAEKSKENSE